MHVLKTPRHLMDTHLVRVRAKVDAARVREPEKVTDLENLLIYMELIFFTRISGVLTTLGDIPNPRAHIPNPQ